MTGDKSSIDRQIEAHVIDATDVPDGFFELRRRIAREQGRGELQITPEMRRQMTEVVQADQRASLDRWVEYLGGENGGYPDWFKTYAWTSVTKLGAYDKDKSEFQKRTRGTTAPYPELNREALAYVYDVLNKSRIEGKQINGGANDAQLQKLLKGGNFGKLYSHAVLEATPATPELRNEIRGSWTNFNQTDDPRTARRLSASLQGHGTGWCTAGESTAIMQLRGGDFFVYYTRDEDGKDTVPRVAIRMEKHKVAEVRGINAAQELEHELADITAERLTDLPGGEEYIRKAQDMKRLTAIEKKAAADPNLNLTAEELRFLYELDHEIQGFGYEADPRISEIRTMRGDIDKLELVRLLPESIRQQIGSAFVAYNTVAEQLDGKQQLPRKGETTLSSNELERLIAIKDKQWQTNGTYDYVVEQLIENGARFTLVATPNIEASEAQIVALAENFGKDQPDSTYVHAELYRKGRYDDCEWSGRTDDAPVRLNLIPSRPDSQLSNKRAEEQVRLLRELQVSKPELHARVPSLLDAVTYWYSLRAQGNKLDDKSAYYKTYIRHIDLVPKTDDGWAVHPCSYVGVDGEPCLDYSGASGEVGVRLAVG